jgi:hypothetical protein
LPLVEHDLAPGPAQDLDGAGADFGPELINETGYEERDSQLSSLAQAAFEFGHLAHAADN